MLKEFREFIMRGNVMDLAVGVMIGGAFQKIATSLVNDILMPIIGVFTAGVSLSDLSAVIRPAVMDGDTVVKAAVLFRYGGFIQSIIDFIIIAFCIFIIVKAANTVRNKFDDMKKSKEEEIEQAPVAQALTKEQELLCEIRDLLKENNKETGNESK